MRLRAEVAKCGFQLARLCAVSEVHMCELASIAITAVPLLLIRTATTSVGVLAVAAIFAIPKLMENGTRLFPDATCML